MITKNKTVDKLLETYKDVLKTDYNVYRNHIYRIYNYAVLLDDDANNYEKYAIAAVFHDLGIWTHSFDYLKPSIQLASEYLTKVDKQDWIEEIALMIDNHHKMSRYEGKFNKTVEIFRKADWIDVIMGMKLFELDRSKYESIQSKISNKGFHWFLIKQSSAYFVKHPLNPLPMFKK